MGKSTLVKLKNKMFESIKFVIADYLNRSDKYCWTELVMWCQGYRKLKETKCGLNCKKEINSPPLYSCYCGKFLNKEFYKKEK